MAWRSARCELPAVHAVQHELLRVGGFHTHFVCRLQAPASGKAQLLLQMSQPSSQAEQPGSQREAAAAAAATSAPAPKSGLAALMRASKPAAAEGERGRGGDADAEETKTTAVHARRATTSVVE